MSRDVRFTLTQLTEYLEQAYKAADTLPATVPLRGPIHDLIEEVKFLDALLEADPGLFSHGG